MDTIFDKVLGNFSGHVVADLNYWLARHPNAIDSTSNVLYHLARIEKGYDYPNPAVFRPGFWTDVVLVSRYTEGKHKDGQWRMAVKDYCWNQAANCGD